MYKRYNDGYEPKTTCHIATEAAIAAGASLLGSAGSVVFNAGQSKKQREWSEKMQNQQNAWNMEMWNKTNEYNSPEQQVQRLRDAGLNPLYYGLDGSSANALESAQPLGYERANMSAQDNPLAAGVAAGMQMKSLQKDIELKNAQIDKLGADAEGVKLDNEFKDMTMDARAEAETLANNATKEQIGKIKDERKQILANIKKTEEETKNEAFKGLLIQAQTAVEKANEKQILEMLPYQKLLAEAQTQAQKAAAMASYYNALTQKGLLDAGYIDKYIDGMAADIRGKNANAFNAESIAAINQFKAAVKSGNIFAINENESWVTATGKQLLNALFNDVSILGEALTGGLTGILK